MTIDACWLMSCCLTFCLLFIFKWKEISYPTHICTYSYCPNTSLQSSGNKMLILKMRNTKKGWHIEVIDRFAPNRSANMANEQPPKKYLWFDSPIQQSSQTLWWSRFAIHCWQSLQWNARGGMYRRHFGHTLFVLDIIKSHGSESLSEFSFESSAFSSISSTSISKRVWSTSRTCPISSVCGAT